MTRPSPISFVTLLFAAVTLAGCQTSAHVTIERIQGVGDGRLKPDSNLGRRLEAADAALSLTRKKLAEVQRDVQRVAAKWPKLWVNDQCDHDPAVRMRHVSEAGSWTDRLTKLQLRTDELQDESLRYFRPKQVQDPLLASFQVRRLLRKIEKFFSDSYKLFMDLEARASRLEEEIEKQTSDRLACLAQFVTEGREVRKHLDEAKRRLADISKLKIALRGKLDKLDEEDQIALHEYEQAWSKSPRVLKWLAADISTAEEAGDTSLAGELKGIRAGLSKYAAVEKSQEFALWSIGDESKKKDALKVAVDFLEARPESERDKSRDKELAEFINVRRTVLERRKRAGSEKKLGNAEFQELVAETAELEESEPKLVASIDEWDSKAGRLKDTAQALADVKAGLLAGIAEKWNRDIAAITAGVTTAGFGGFMTPDIYPITPSDPKYQEVLSKADFRMLSEVSVHLTGDASIMLVFEDPAEVRVYQVSNDPTQITRNIAFLVSKASLAIAKFAAVGVTP